MRSLSLVDLSTSEQTSPLGAFSVQKIEPNPTRRKSRNTNTYTYITYVDTQKRRTVYKMLYKPARVLLYSL